MGGKSKSRKRSEAKAEARRAVKWQKRLRSRKNRCQFVLHDTRGDILVFKCLRSHKATDGVHPSQLSSRPVHHVHRDVWKGMVTSDVR